MAGDFNEAVKSLSLLNFSDYLHKVFGDETAQNVFRTFQQMGLPVPVHPKEFLVGHEGTTILLNPYGLVVRIEHKNFTSSPQHPEYWRFDRINDNPWILQPLGSIDVGAAVIEICPGTPIEQDQEIVERLAERLAMHEIDFWDAELGNVGRIPIGDSEDWISVVIDRLGVRWREVSNAPRWIDELDMMREEIETEDATAAIEKFYAPLRQSFKECFPDAQKMQQFWNLCLGHEQEGKLVAGWNAASPNVAMGEKTIAAVEISKNYAVRLQATVQSVSSAAPAVLQSRPQSV